MIYNDCEKVCLFVCFVPTNICKTELFRPRNPYDTDLPVISDARELFVLFFFSFFLGSFLLVVVVVGILIRDV